MLPVFLVGYRCTGKTTIGRLLARALGRPFVDTDTALEARFNISIAQMVANKGWDHFREMENRVLTSLDISSAPVVATGGGIILAEKNRVWIHDSGICVWLHADVSTLLSRLSKDAELTDHRPDLTGHSLEEETREMLDIRTPLYREMAQIIVDTARYTPEDAAHHIIRRLENERL
ncbi:MAG: shikimate kinase AroL [Desulfobacter sp.]|nr:MAG: shikimate kinase AroL [Desulfobacter sp.]